MVVQCIPATWLFARRTGGQHGVGRDCGVESRKERGAQRTKRLPIASTKWLTGHVAERNAWIAVHTTNQHFEMQVWCSSQSGCANESNGT